MAKPTDGWLNRQPRPGPRFLPHRRTARQAVPSPTVGVSWTGPKLGVDDTLATLVTITHARFPPIDRPRPDLWLGRPEDPKQGGGLPVGEKHPDPGHAYALRRTSAEFLLPNAMQFATACSISSFRPVSVT